MEHPIGLFGLLLIRSRCLLRHRRLHDRGARGQVRRSVPVDASCSRAPRRGARRGAGRGRVSGAACPRRGVCAADARRHLRPRNDRAQHADRRRPRRLSVRGHRSGTGANALGRVLRDGAGTGGRHADDCAGNPAGAPRHGPVRDSRRRGRCGSDGRSYLSLQARRPGHFMRSRRYGRRHPGAVRVVRHREQHLQHHRSVDRHPDERAGRNATLGGSGAWRHGHYAIAVCVDSRGSGGDGQGGQWRHSGRGGAFHAQWHPRIAARQVPGTRPVDCDTADAGSTPSNAASDARRCRGARHGRESGSARRACRAAQFSNCRCRRPPRTG